jgi:hypothetical protein
VLCQHLRDRRRQGRLAVIDMPDRPDIDVRLAAVKFLFCHRELYLEKRLSQRASPGKDRILG